MCRLAEEGLLGGYKLGVSLGKGNFAEVRAARNSATGQLCAAKLVTKRKVGPVSVEKESSHHLSLKHENIVRLFDVVDAPHHVCLFMEYVPGGDLLDYILKRVRLREETTLEIFHQTIAAVEHCHSHLIAHRDIKPENILLDHNNTVKLADFGLSGKIVPGSPMTTACGSPNYAAPEVLSKSIKIDGYDGQAVDVWSCGVVLFAMITGDLPFDDQNFVTLRQKIRAGKYRDPNYASVELRKLMARMLNVNPQERITIPEILESSWLADSPFAKCTVAMGPESDSSSQPVSEEACGYSRAEAFAMCEAPLGEESATKACGYSRADAFAWAVSTLYEESAIDAASTLAEGVNFFVGVGYAALTA